MFIFNCVRYEILTLVYVPFTSRMAEVLPPLTPTTVPVVYNYI